MYANGIMCFLQWAVGFSEKSRFYSQVALKRASWLWHMFKMTMFCVFTCM